MTPPAGIPGLPGAATALLALLGDPVAHSLSPALHNAALRADGLDAAYLAFRVTPERLAEAMRGLWALGAWGANVTLPHKEAACAAAATRAEAAAATGAANVLVRDRHGWRADNTDVAGFLAPLAPFRDAVAGGRVVVLGAGGSARAVAYGALTLGPAEVVVAARRPAQAEALVAALGAPPGLTACPLAEAGVAGAALVVNTTPAGMWPHADQTPWPDARAFHEGQIVYDLVYRPRETRLLREAATRGATPIGGLPMLLGQAAEAYRLWTGRPMPRAAAEAAARSALDVPHDGPAS